MVIDGGKWLETGRETGVFGGSRDFMDFPVRVKSFGQAGDLVLYF